MRGRVLRIYPTHEQIERIEKNFGAKRFIYNYFLDRYLKFREPIILYNTLREVTALKKELNYDWLNSSDSVALQECIKDLITAVKRYESKLSGKPKRKKKDKGQSYRTNNNNNNIRIENRQIKLPKIGRIKFSGYDNLQGEIISATIKRIDDKYYCSLCMREDAEDVEEDFRGEYEVNVIDVPEYLYHSIIEGQSGNRMDDFLQKLSTDILRGNSRVVVKDYEEQILPESEYNKLVRMLKYKSEVYKCDIICDSSVI